MAEFLKSRGFDVRLDYPVAGTSMDLVYRLGTETRGIDLVGYPGDFADAFPLDQLLVFRRAGVKVYPLPYSAWVERRAACEAFLAGATAEG